MLKFIDIPKAASPFESSKVMIVMHGRGDVKESFIPFSKELNVTGLAYRLLDAPTPFMFGQSWYAAAPQDPIPDINQSVLLIQEHIKDLNLATEDIFLAGFSQGGGMALEVALQTKQTFAGVIALSPRIFIRAELIELAKNTKNTFFIAHGEHDNVIPFDETKNGVSSLKAAGCDVNFHNFEMAHEIDVMEILKLRSWVNERL